MKGKRNSSYVFNAQTLKYEKKVTPLSTKLWRGLAFLVCAVVLGLVSNRLFTDVFPSFKYRALKVELNEMRTKYETLNDQVDLMSVVLNNIQDRDANVHRMIFGLEPVDSSIWNGGVGGHRSYTQYDGFENKEILTSTLEKVDRLSRQMTMQSLALDEVEQLTADKERFLSCIPSIKPVASAKLKKNLQYLSGFGMRMHPIYKIPKMHNGLDFTAPIGTEVQVSGDGVVVRVENKRNGFGRMVQVDHGYGYKTLYAHLSETNVKTGQKVKKGQTIGKVGNTGTSTAPHLHYEVHFKGRPVNPIDFVMDGLSPEEYQELVKKSQESNKSLD